MGDLFSPRTTLLTLSIPQRPHHFLQTPLFSAPGKTASWRMMFNPHLHIPTLSQTSALLPDIPYTTFFLSLQPPKGNGGEEAMECMESCRSMVKSEDITGQAAFRERQNSWFSLEKHMKVKFYLKNCKSTRNYVYLMTLVPRSHFF